MQKTRWQASLPLWTAAICVGSISVLYARLIAFAQSLFQAQFDAHGRWVALACPFLFLAATALVVFFAPEAKGSGIPQVIEAIEDSAHPTEEGNRLVSIKTAVVKVLSSLIGILGGASIGREGPTVQLAASGFSFFSRLGNRFSLGETRRVSLVAGGAAGVAAAFNTPVAGITFALEELLEGSFGEVKVPLTLSVIIAGITAQGLTGNYLYFGHPVVESVRFLGIPESLSLGVLGGMAGGAFSKLLAQPSIARLPRHWSIRAFVCGLICAALFLFSHGDTAGSGYEMTRHSLESAPSHFQLMMPVYKFIATVVSYLSGMAGGIFSPCLSIGAALGESFSLILHFPDFKVCALIGMVAFFSGVVQAPITSVVIVLEMTDQHALLFPFLLTSILAQQVGRIWMPVPLYAYLAGRGAMS